jgi:hypothetical protein
MKKLTTKFMIATATLVVAAGFASAQTMTAGIPFEFRAGNQVMAPGTYQVDRLATQTGVPIYKLLDVHSRRSIALLAQASVDRRTGWTEENAKLVFACTSGSCALAELWSGSESHGYAFARPKLGKDEDAVLREIPMQPGKGE